MIKMLGLAAIAALGLMAFVGAGTASASTALSTDGGGTIKYAKGTVIESTLKTGTSADLKDTSNNTIATCTSSTVSGKTTVETSSSVEGKIETLEFSACSQTTDVLAKGVLSITKSGPDTGTVMGASSKVTLGIFGVSCVYGTGEGTKLGTLTGGAEPVLAINASLPKIEGPILCPSTGVWTANYIITVPHAVHIVE